MCFRKPSVIAYAAVVGKAENEGPYGGEFDEVVEDNKAGSDTWEQAESLFQQRAVGHVLRKSGLEPDRIDLMIAGDLLNQCVGSSYGLKDYFIPYLGIYGACSTFAEGLLLSAALVNAGYIDTAIASTSSHFSTAERQFRFPLNYGGVRTPTAQWTATAAGAALVGFSGKPPFIRAATVGKIEDMGITDLNNMGAAMAGAAYDTLTRHMKHRGTHPQDYDVIITGDLGQVGSDLLYDLFQRDGVSLREHHKDCGLMIYDRAAQDVHAGGSGCGCSASMMCGHFFKRIQAGELKRVLYCATGALMSPTVVQQGGSIPGIAHCVEISSEAGG
ncbi:stage V sporulation protein AD [Eubacterium sp. CAG:115]|jgi:stage V sporulation protein AD|nr:stage V sporulation protein AD [Eubacterium sp. CAG:115]